jgi:hypothetical protein
VALRAPDSAAPAACLDAADAEFLEGADYDIHALALELAARKVQGSSGGLPEALLRVLRWSVFNITSQFMHVNKVRGEALFYAGGGEGWRRSQVVPRWWGCSPRGLPEYPRVVCITPSRVVAEAPAGRQHRRAASAAARSSMSCFCVLAGRTCRLPPECSLTAVSGPPGCIALPTTLQLPTTLPNPHRTTSGTPPPWPRR